MCTLKQTPCSSLASDSIDRHEIFVQAHLRSHTHAHLIVSIDEANE